MNKFAYRVVGILLVSGLTRLAGAAVDLQVAEPTFQDFTNATVVATVTGEVAAPAAYVATVNGVEYAGTRTGDTVTFQIPGATGSPARGAVVVTSGGATVATAPLVFAFGARTRWFDESAAADKFGKSGTWSENVTTNAGQIVFELEEDEVATFVPSTNTYGRIVDVTATFASAGPNDEAAPTNGMRAAFRIAEDDLGYKFQVWECGAETSAWVDVTAAGVTPAVETNYTLVTRFDYSQHTFSMTIDGADVTAAGSRTAFGLSTNGVVSTLMFRGAGSVAAMDGRFYDNTLFTDTDGNRYARIEDVPTNKTVVVSDRVSSVTVEPGKKMAVPSGFDVKKIKVSYKGASLAQYVTPTIVDNRVRLNVTEAAKPTVGAMQMPDEGGVKLAIPKPVPGLFYGLVVSDSLSSFGSAEAVEKKQYTGEGALDLKPGAAPTEGANVKYYRVRVTAE